MMRANETLARILERTGTLRQMLRDITGMLGEINKALWPIIGELAVIIALMIPILLRIL